MSRTAAAGMATVSNRETVMTALSFFVWLYNRFGEPYRPRVESLWPSPGAPALAWDTRHKDGHLLRPRAARLS